MAVASPTSDEATPEGSAATAPAQPSESPAETPSPAAEQPTETTPTETATPDGAGDTVQLGQERRVEEAGFSFRPPAEYALEFAGASVTLSAAERSPASGAVMLLRADLAAELLPEPADSLGEAFASFVAAYTAERDLVADEAEAVRVGGEAALGADLSDGGDGGGFAGRVVMTEPRKIASYHGRTGASRGLAGTGRRRFRRRVGFRRFLCAQRNADRRFAHYHGGDGADRRNDADARG